MACELLDMVTSQGKKPITQGSSSTHLQYIPPLIMQLLALDRLTQKKTGFLKLQFLILFAQLFTAD